MALIPVYYNTVYRLIIDKNIHFTKDFNICFNYSKQSKKKITLNGVQRGIWLNSKTFIKSKNFKELSELIPKDEYITDDFLTNL